MASTLRLRAEQVERRLWIAAAVAMSAAALLTAPARAQNAPGFFVDDDADDRGAIALTQLPRRGLNSYCQKSAVVSEIRAYVFAVTADKLPADWTYRQQMRHMEVFDVQNLTTTELDINRNRFSCHGVLVLENNRRSPAPIQNG